MAVSAKRPWSRRWAVILSSIAAIAVAAWLIHYGAYPYQVGPKQPLPFSHRIHAGVRQISCLFCHDGADRSKNAGMPEVRKCLLCHNVIITQFAPIRDLHGYFDRRQPVPWTRVYDLPDYAHFNHDASRGGRGLWPVPRGCEADGSHHPGDADGNGVLH